MLRCIVYIYRRSAIRIFIMLLAVTLQLNTCPGQLQEQKSVAISFMKKNIVYFHTLLSVTFPVR